MSRSWKSFSRQSTNWSSYIDCINGSYYRDSMIQFFVSQRRRGRHARKWNYWEDNEMISRVIRRNSLTQQTIKILRFSRIVYWLCSIRKTRSVKKSTRMIDSFRTHENQSEERYALRDQNRTRGESLQSVRQTTHLCWISVNRANTTRCRLRSFDVVSNLS